MTKEVFFHVHVHHLDTFFCKCLLSFFLLVFLPFIDYISIYNILCNDIVIIHIIIVYII